MQVKTIITNTLGGALIPMHKCRREAVFAAVGAALEGQSLAVSALGRGLNGLTDEKHQIKRMDRLLSNSHLQAERVSIYSAVAKLMLGAATRPVIAVDWSDLDGSKRHYLLRASLVIEGRSLTLYEEVHTLSGKDKRVTHKRFLGRLQAIVPATAQPVLVSDAGFRTPWFRQVLALGWDYVGRVRNRHLVRRDPCEAWFDAKILYARATTKAKDLGDIELTRSNPLGARLVVVRQPKRGRSKWTLAGQRARSKRSEQHAAREREPWLLVTSLSSQSARAKRVVSIYAGRMQIEESFRDLKSERFGLGFEVSRSRITQRIAVLLLIALLALLVAWIVGTCVENNNQQRRYQANTERRRRVLSVIYLGRRALHDRRLNIDRRQLSAADEHRAQLVHNAFYQH